MGDDWSYRNCNYLTYDVKLKPSFFAYLIQQEDMFLRMLSNGFCTSFIASLGRLSVTSFSSMLSFFTSITKVKLKRMCQWVFQEGSFHLFLANADAFYVN